MLQCVARRLFNVVKVLRPLAALCRYALYEVVLLFIYSFVYLFIYLLLRHVAAQFIYIKLHKTQELKIEKAKT